MPLVLSVVNGLVNIIPYFGPIIGGVPIVFIAMTSSVTKGIIALVGVFIIQQVEGDVLAPKITGDCISMHPVTIILLLILGEKLAGVAGMVLCVPIAVSYTHLDYTYLMDKLSYGWIRCFSFRS